MDYARFNYIAQPGDEGVALMPDIGVYDKYAIQLGLQTYIRTNLQKKKRSILRSMDYRTCW